MIIDRRTLLCAGGAAVLTSASPLSASARSARTFSIWTTPQMIAGLRKRVASRSSPFYQAWQYALAIADLATDRNGHLVNGDFIPFRGAQGRTVQPYFNVGVREGIALRCTALAYHVTGREPYAAKVREVLLLWAREGARNRFPTSYPADAEPFAAGLVIARVITPLADAYAMVYDTMAVAERQIVDDWLMSMVDPIIVSRRIMTDWGSTAAMFQYFNNHLSAHNMGLLAIGVAVNNQDLVHYVLGSELNPRSLRSMIDGAIIMPADVRSGETGDVFGRGGDSAHAPDRYKDKTVTQNAPEPEAGEIYDRYRMYQDRGLADYAPFHLMLMTLTAEIAFNNNLGDFYRYNGPNGENLERSFEYYSKFFITGDSGTRSGYYTGPPPPYNAIGFYEYGLHRYPENAAIKAVLVGRRGDRARASEGRLLDDRYLGRTAILTHGLDIQDERPTDR